MSINNYQELVNKIDSLKKQDKMDLSSDQDLSIAIMNLISIEEHFFFTGIKTGKANYFDLLNQVRALRKELLKKIIKDYEGEVWCISKHLLAASMRLMEVGTKALGRDNRAEAEDLFKKAFDLYSLFWAVNMGMIDTSGIKKLDDNMLNKKDEKKTGLMGKFSAIVKKVIDCCIE
ncbi:MAG: hypothetical protein UU95_C0010G0005 [Parcubacteria group bacterium GW2011_GWC2_42_12]|nr:MAG: hypothetical protein UU95_C0010G0005 [Parcubacteria group bacterium GW2011_GWC2_42_12]